MGACIERAHPLGRFATGKCRPVIVKFSSYKSKESVILSQQKLKAIGLSVSCDFLLATRQTRRKLILFGKCLAVLFKLRYNKLYVDRKCSV